jgi:hypothetical protein
MSPQRTVRPGISSALFDDPFDFALEDFPELFWELDIKSSR